MEEGVRGLCSTTDGKDLPDLRGVTIGDPETDERRKINFPGPRRVRSRGSDSGGVGGKNFRSKRTQSYGRGPRTSRVSD